KSDVFSRFQNGFQHNIPITLSLNVLKYFQFNSSVNYTERWYLQSVNRKLENTPAGFVSVQDTVRGFKRAYDYSVSSGLSTIFQGGIFGTPGMGKQMSIGFSIDNNIESKILSRRDTTSGGEKKIQILQGLTFSGNYNFAADSMQLSMINFSGRTALFNDKVSVSFYGMFDPYQVNSQGQRINRFAIKDGKLARLVNFGLSMDYSINSESVRNRSNQLDQMNQGMASLTPEQQNLLARVSGDPNAFVDFNIPWNLAGSFSFQYNNFGTTSQITSTLNVYGDFNITDKWKVQFNSGYDFKNK